MKPSPIVHTSTSAEVDTFLAKMRGLSAQPAAHGGRLIFALDATASRQPTWDTACQLQAEMFRETVAIGGLSVQLVYYRGLGECRASRWLSQPGASVRTDGADRLPHGPHSAREGPRPCQARDFAP
jgi:hypothetical protein